MFEDLRFPYFAVTKELSEHSGSIGSLVLISSGAFFSYLVGFIGFERRTARGPLGHFRFSRRTRFLGKQVRGRAHSLPQHESSRQLVDSVFLYR